MHAARSHHRTVNLELVERAVEAGRVRHGELSREVRRAHGIVHTPAEVARWALSQVDARLRSQLGCARGLSDPRVALLDPALGTGIWLAAALERMSLPYRSSGGDTAHHGSVAGRGPHLLGFDIDRAAITAAHALLDPSAHGAHATLSLVDANMLTVADPWGPTMHDHVRVIVGNPPWSARSQSRGLALSDQWLAEFRCDAQGVSLGERRSGVLSDDYVRFFRWALEQARESPAGAILCLATNSSYLDGPVHRGMRAALVHAFDEIDVLDLGGNALRGSDGSRDENVFGVRVGTCLTIAVRRPGQGVRQAELSYAKLSGSCSDKLERLSHDVQASTYVSASGPSYCFVPPRHGSDRKPSAQPTFSLAEAFPFHREGVQTNRDAFVTDSCRERLLERLHSFADGKITLRGAPQLSSHESLAALQASLNADAHGLIRPLAYRPLDDRFCFSLAPFCHRPRPELARAVTRSTVCLLSARKDRGQGAWNLFGVTRSSADGCYLSTRSSCRTRVFPSHNPTGAANLDGRLCDELSTHLTIPITSETLIAYCVGVLASHSFRRDHAGDLHADYPRLPRPSDRAIFEAHCAAGAAWMAAWLKPEALNYDDNESELNSIAYDPARSELHWGERIVEGVEPDLWQLSIGDFAPLMLLSRTPISLPRLSAVVARVSACRDAATQAESAYQLARPVR